MEDNDRDNNEKIKREKRTFSKGMYAKSIAYGICAIMVVVTIIMIKNSIVNAAGSLINSFSETEAETAEEKYNDIYRRAYDYAEEQYHAKNEVSLNISSILEKESLEVLSVEDCELVIADDEDTSAWIEVFGKGVFTVNLAGSEVNVDSERKYIHVRVPKPKMERCTAVENKLLHCENNHVFFDGNYTEGTDKAAELISIGLQSVKRSIESNVNFISEAEKSAISMISALIRSANPDVTNLTVEVSFFD